MLLKDLPKNNIKEWAHRIAHEHNISDQPDSYSRMALKISSLSGDDVVIDETGTLLMNMFRAGLITQKDLLQLAFVHLRESVKKPGFSPEAIEEIKK